MANLEKHKRNLVDEFLEGDEPVEAAQSRSVHLVGAQRKAAKGVPRRFRLVVSNGQPVKADPALIREPAQPPKAAERASQANSPAHLRKLQRLPKLRAPYSKPGRRLG
jgi:hypothetical protein